MTVSKADMLHEARMAFDAGDHRRGGAILHEIFKQDITHEAAWQLLYAALGRDEAFESFQLDFISRYYPEEIDRFRGVKTRGHDKSLRRVSLGISRAEPASLKPIRLVDLPTPRTSPVLESRRLDESEPAVEAGVAPAPEMEADEAPAGTRPKRGLFKRLGAFFGRLIPRRKARVIKAEAPERQEKRSAEFDDIVMPDAGLAPLSLKDLPKQKPSAPGPAQKKPASPRSRPGAPPLLTKFHKERVEIRLVIADDIPQTRENIRKLLIFEPSVDVVAVAANGEEAIARALEFEPDIVLMDINMPGMDGLAALKTIREALPLTQVIMLTVQDDPGYLREALQLGARDYLIKPPTIDELLEAIQNTHEIGRAERDRVERAYTPPPEVEEVLEEADGIAIAVYSPKGGVGCTFIASNLAVALKADARDVVLVDADLEFGGIGLFFNAQARSSIVDLAVNVHELDLNMLRDGVIQDPESGIRLVLAPPSPEDAEKVNGEQLTELIRFLRRRYAYVVVDTGSIMDVHAAAVLAECDQVLLVTTQEIPAINNLRLALNFAPQIGLSESRVSLVLNMYNKRVNITPEQISANLKRSIVAVIPQDNRTAIPSINRGVPFMLAPDARALPIGAAIQALAEELRVKASAIV